MERTCLDACLTSCDWLHMEQPIFLLGPASFDSWLHGHACGRRWDHGTTADAVFVFISATISLSTYQYSTGTAPTCKAPAAPWRKHERVWPYAVCSLCLGFESCLGHYVGRAYPHSKV